MPRPNRSASDAHDGLKAGRRVSPHHTAVPLRTWSLPVTTVLRWLLAGLLAIVTLSLFGDVALDLVRGWLA